MFNFGVPVFSADNNFQKGLSRIQSNIARNQLLHLQFDVW